MKRIILILYTFITFISFNTYVRAADEINIVVNANDEITVSDKNNNVITDESVISNYFTYDNGIFTLKEGKYFNKIELLTESDYTITSNNKKVYINYIDGYYNDGNTYTGPEIVIDKLNYENFVPDGTKWDNDYSISSMKKLDIIDSNIKINKIGNDIFQISNWSQDDLVIKNSTIDSQYSIETAPNKIMKITNSKIKVLGINAKTKPWFLNLVAEDSDIVFFGTDIKAWPVYNNVMYRKDDYTLLQNLELRNSKLSANSITINEGVKLINSEMSFDGVLYAETLDLKDSTFYSNGVSYPETIIMNNSKMISTKEQILNIASTNIELKESLIDIAGPLSAVSINLDNSELKVSTNEYTLDDIKMVAHYIPLTVEELKMKNSKITAISNNNLPAFVSLNKINVEDDYKFKNDKNQILEYKATNKTIENFIEDVGLERRIDNQFYSDNFKDTSKTLYTFYNNDKISNYVTTIEPVKETKPINNPKTGVNSLILVFYLAIICIALVLKKNKETSYFRKRI